MGFTTPYSLGCAPDAVPFYSLIWDSGVLHKRLERLHMGLHFLFPYMGLIMTLLMQIAEPYGPPFYSLIWDWITHGS